MEKNEPVETKIGLKNFKAGLMAVISKEMAEAFANVDIKIWEDFELDLLHIRATMDVLGFNAQSVEVKYPANWKEAVKECFAPAWAKKLWPVKYRRIVLERNALYPKLPIIKGVEARVSLRVEDYGDVR